MHRLTQLRYVLQGALAMGADFVAHALARQSLAVAAFSAVNKVVGTAIPVWNMLHPELDIELVSRQFAHHHGAMTRGAVK